MPTKPTEMVLTILTRGCDSGVASGRRCLSSDAARSESGGQIAAMSQAMDGQAVLWFLTDRSQEILANSATSSFTGRYVRPAMARWA